MNKGFTIEHVRNIIKNSDCELITNEYFNTKQNLDIKCKCGNIFTTTLNRFQAGKIKCNDCSGTAYSYKYMKDYIEAHGGNLITKSIKNGRQNIDVLCPCGEVFSVTFFRFKNKNKHRCNQCTIKRKNNLYLEKEEVEEFLKSKDLELISEYKNSTEKIEVRCPCGRSFSRSFNKIKSSNQIRCYSCVSGTSKIEALAEDFFRQHNINYKTQVTFKDLKVRYNVCLRFDFGIYDEEDNLKFLLELDGEQHYRAVSKFGGSEQLEKQQNNDMLKNNYCDANDIILKRIPYWKFNKIHEELQKALKYDNPVPSYN